MFSTLRQEADPNDTLLAAEREAVHPVFSQSPFIDLADEDSERERLQTRAEDANPERPWNDHVVVRVADEVPWIDLILEIAMTTALANLVANTTISRGKDVLGYFCFWTLTWWVWASQAAFNVRFRQGDTLNRIAAVLQLAVFGSLSAFTTDFDITDGLGKAQTRFDAAALSIQAQLNYSTVLDVHQHIFQTDNHISILNFRGISMTMALSRLLLMVQYSIAVYYAARHRPSQPSAIRSFFSASTSLLLHVFVLLFSAICFFAAFGVIGHNPSVRDNIVKIVLWYTAISVELFSHFIPPLFNLNGHVRYPPASLYSRASVLFVVVIGQELDKLTGTFRTIVGPAGFDATSTIILISAGIILIGQFFFFFGCPGLKKKNTRGLAWFFGQFIYTMVLIIFLSGAANQLISFNLNRTQSILLDAVYHIETLQSATLPNLLSVQDVPFNDTNALNKSGIATADVVSNVYSAMQVNGTDQDARMSQLKAGILGISYQQFDLYPSPENPTFWMLELQYNSSDPVYTNSSATISIISQLTRANVDSIKWFPASAGMTLFTLGILRLIRQSPRDKWEWASVLNLVGGGLVYLPLSIMDIDSWKQIETINPHDFSVHLHSAIWRFAASGWPLPSFAILTVLVMICDATCHRLARQSYRGNATHQYHDIQKLNEKLRSDRESETNAIDVHQVAPRQA